jgi:hypothetical protein
MKRLALLAMLALSAPWALADEALTMEQVLAQAGLARGDLLIAADADWLGSPDPALVPYVLPHLVPIVPADAIARALNLKAVAEATVDNPRHPQRLLALLTSCCLQPRLAGFRGFVPAAAAASGAGSLTRALERLDASDAGWQAVAMAAPPAPLPAPGEAELALPEPLRPPLAELLTALAEAAAWVERSWLRVPDEVLAEAARSPHLTRALAGGELWWPALEAAARNGDDVARAHALLRLASAAAAAERALAGASTQGREGLPWSVATRRGRVTVAGDGADRHHCDNDCLLLVDLGGDDTYHGSAAAAVAPHQAVAMVLDLGGDDQYRQGAEAAAQGAGVGGVGLLLDAGGDDTYAGSSHAQGFGLLGYGVLVDLAGDDTYGAADGAQGAALFGGAMLLDGGGRDSYRVLGEGQGFGGPAGAAALVDLAGDDSYRAEADPALAGRADPHSNGEVAANFAQGVGVGRRGDLSDGHLWAGGVGTLIDLAGDDLFAAGNFAQGLGYCFGTGLLIDGGGDDRYLTSYFSQGAGLHFSLGILIDLAGHDSHWLGQRAGASLGYGWDFAAGIVVDGGGSDLYRVASTSLGSAERRSLGLFVELGGCDTYLVEGPGRVLGAVDHGPGTQLRGLRSAAATSSQTALFVDLGGADSYLLPAGAPPAPANGSAWTWPGRGSGWAAHNVGLGLDLDHQEPADPLRWLLSWQ